MTLSQLVCASSKENASRFPPPPPPPPPLSALCSLLSALLSALCSIHKSELTSSLSLLAQLPPSTQPQLAELVKDCWQEQEKRPKFGEIFSRIQAICQACQAASAPPAKRQPTFGKTLAELEAARSQQQASSRNGSIYGHIGNLSQSLILPPRPRPRSTPGKPSSVMIALGGRAGGGGGEEEEEDAGKGVRFSVDSSVPPTLLEGKGNDGAGGKSKDYSKIASIRQRPRSLSPRHGKTISKQSSHLRWAPPSKSFKSSRSVGIVLGGVAFAHLVAPRSAMGSLGKDIPEQLLPCILCLLDLASLCGLAQTSRWWHQQVCASPSLWRALFQRRLASAILCCSEETAAQLVNHLEARVATRSLHHHRYQDLYGFRARGSFHFWLRLYTAYFALGRTSNQLKEAASAPNGSPSALLKLVRCTPNPMVSGWLTRRHTPPGNVWAARCLHHVAHGLLRRTKQ